MSPNTTYGGTPFSSANRFRSFLNSPNNPSSHGKFPARDTFPALDPPAAATATAGDRVSKIGVRFINAAIPLRVTVTV
jgi:hypothetical protein